MRERNLKQTIPALLLAAGMGPASLAQQNAGWGMSERPGAAFERIATFPVFLNTDETLETVAEIVAAARDGNLLVYTDSETGNLGFVDITDPRNPVAAGAVPLAGEPTSVAIVDDYALAVVNTSADFVNTSGQLQIIDIETRQIVRSIELAGQPDSIAISPDNRYAAIAIENERDEDLGDGEPPQLPAGFVVIIDLVGGPNDWTTRNVELTGVPDLFPDDPEPEFIDINSQNLAAVTLQENNHVALIDLASGQVVWSFSAGSADLNRIDTVENDLIEQNSALQGVPREPDAVTWINDHLLATADEGDLFGGSRGFTIFDAQGNVLVEAGASVEHAVARIGHYPEDRSENKGNEPEGINSARFGDTRYLFVASERSNVVLVYRLVGGAQRVRPVLVQALPTGVGPEGIIAIPQRDLLVVANEVDARDDVIRSTIMIYERTGQGTYPDIVSRTGQGGVPIPWAALSGLARDPHNDERVYTIHDSFYRKSRIYSLNVRRETALINAQTVLSDASSVLLDALNDLKANLPGTDDFDPAAIVNDDQTVNLDLEGVEYLGEQRFLVASEGSGNLVGGVSDPDNRPFRSPNLVALVNHGLIEHVFLPPIEITRNQFRFGFEGVAASGDVAYVAFQRAWQDAADPADTARIGRIDLNTGEWTFARYPLDAVESPNAGWVGLSEITALDDGTLLVLERDNQGGPDARVKRLYTIDPASVTFRPEGDALDVLAKSLLRDLMLEGDLTDTAGIVPEKLEGLTVVNNQILIVNDNDGVDDNSGETRLFRIDN